MKNKYFIIALIFITLYIITLVFLFLNFQISKEILIRLIFSVIGMVFLIILSLKYKSDFVLFFTSISFIFYLFDPFFSICYSLIKRENLALINTSFLSNTEGFIMFTCLGYVLFRLFKKDKV
jgi:hypothetical protein